MDVIIIQKNLKNLRLYTRKVEMKMLEITFKIV